ncbi:MAG: hypothetical protein ACKO37_03130 [Vampirovibrionales bacterium]
MTLETFLHKMNGGTPIDVKFDEGGDGTIDASIRYLGDNPK